MAAISEPVLSSCSVSWIADIAVRPRRKINVLLVEDQVSDADMVVRELRRAGFDPETCLVDCEADFVAQLDPGIDIILADYSLPLFDGLAALRCLQARQLDIPFVIVTGSLGDELAARCIKEGVTDYLLKDRLERLGLAVSHALEERRLRKERAAVEWQLRQSQKMEAVGQLAGGIAHDFNNILTVIKMSVSLLLEAEDVGQSSRELLRQVFAASEKGENLTRQLLVFSRKQPADRRSMQLNAVVDHMVAMLRRLMGAKISLRLNLAPALPAIEADAGMIEQMVMNLTLNARDAMPQGGVIVVRTEACVISSADALDKPGRRAGYFIRLSVQDSGCGIAPEVLPQIFEPFFTTKEPGKGTGLGLATVFRIAQEHQGWVEVTSEVGVGTTFEVFLPPARAPARVPLGNGFARSGR